MIAYYFPPMGGVGVQRTLKFVKYLPEFGWQPHVLTAQGRYGLRDTSLGAQVQEDTPITRTYSLHLPHQLPWRLRNFITRWLLIVDEQIGWLPFATSSGRRLIAKNGGIKVIYSTSAPYTAHLIAQVLHRQMKLPWVADFRDPWLENPYINFPTPFHRRLNEYLERRVFTEAERIVLNTDTARLHYLHKYPNLRAEKLITIPNGYDPADLVEINQDPPPQSPFTIVHLGSLSQRTRSGRYLLQAVHAAIQDGKIPAENLCVRFIGSMDRETQHLVRQLNLEASVEVLGYLPHREALSQLSQADLLLLIPSYGSGAELFVPAKLYEYIGSRVPILCLADPGTSADLITQARSGWVVPPREPDKIGIQLVSLYKLWKNGTLRINPDLNLIGSFERQKLTGRLADIFNQVSKRPDDG